MKTIIVSGALANKYRNGGGAWERLSWVLGLRRLGFDVYFVEQISPENCVDAQGEVTPFDACVNRAWFCSVTEWFGLSEKSALVCTPDNECAGIPWSQLVKVANAAELLVNLSGHLTHTPLIERIRRKAYIDVDPGFTQFWHADPQTPFQVAEHDHYFTIGENIGQADCAIPTCGLAWRPTRQPLILDSWPVAPQNAHRPFTTIASWRGAYGPLTVGAKRYGVKAHEFRKFIELPKIVNRQFEIALDIHPNETDDLRLLHENGWNIADPAQVAGDPARFRQYIQQSGAEFSVAQGVYVETNSGWFSDRTTRYLASGKPALVQDTGFKRNLPTGLGLLTFQDFDEAVAGAKAIASDYDAHCKAARLLAEEYFDSEKILRRLINDTGIVGS
jgi:hypothetical protein